MELSSHLRLFPQSSLYKFNSLFPPFNPSATIRMLLNFSFISIALAAAQGAQAACSFTKATCRMAGSISQFAGGTSLGSSTGLLIQSSLGESYLIDLSSEGSEKRVDTTLIIGQWFVSSTPTGDEVQYDQCMECQSPTCKGKFGQSSDFKMHSQTKQHLTPGLHFSSSFRLHSSTHLTWLLGGNWELWW